MDATVDVERQTFTSQYKKNCCQSSVKCAKNRKLLNCTKQAAPFLIHVKNADAESRHFLWGDEPTTINSGDHHASFLQLRNHFTGQNVHLHLRHGSQIVQKHSHAVSWKWNDLQEMNRPLSGLVPVSKKNREAFLNGLERTVDSNTVTTNLDWWASECHFQSLSCAAASAPQCCVLSWLSPFSLLLLRVSLCTVATLSWHWRKQWKRRLTGNTTRRGNVKNNHQYDSAVRRK